MARAKRVRPPTPPRRVVVTGAAGGVGRQVIISLLDAGYAVRAIDRRPTVAAFLPEPYGDHDQLEWIEQDLRTGDDLEELFAGCFALVHTAAIVTLSETYDTLEPVNVALVEALAQAAHDQGIDHIIHLSCASIYGGDARIRMEDCRVEPLNDYERSKIESEEALKRGAGDTSWTILRLALVYGPGCTSMGAGIATLPPILRDFVRYLPGLAGGPRTNWCHAEDAAGAVLTVLGNDQARGRIFNVADGTALSFGEVLTTIAEAYGMELGPSVPFPHAAIWAILALLIDYDQPFDFFRKVLRYRWRRIQHTHGLSSPLRPRVDRRVLFYIREDAIVVSSALEELGWVRRWPDFREGIVDTVRGYQAMGWVPRLDWSTREAMDEEKPGFGLHYNERFEGWLVHADEATRPLTLDLAVDWHSLPRPLSKTEGFLNGALTIGDQGARPVQGTLVLDFVPGPRLRYQFGFDDADGHAYRFEGTRSLNGLNAREHWFVLDGHLIDQNAHHFGLAQLHFKKLEGIGPTPRLLRTLS